MMNDVIMMSLCTAAERILYPTDGNKIVLTLINVLTLAFAQRIFRWLVSDIMSGSYNLMPNSEPLPLAKENSCISYRQLLKISTRLSEQIRAITIKV
jgi:hypothetical protein